MDIRYYNTRDINLERLAADLEREFVAQGFETQHFGSADHMTVQLRKGGELAAIFGLRSAITVVMQRNPEGLHAAIGQQRWADKAAVGAVGFFFPVLWPLMITAGAGIDTKDSVGDTALFYAARVGRTDHVQRLIGAGAAFGQP